MKMICFTLKIRTDILAIKLEFIPGIVKLNLPYVFMGTRQLRVSFVEKICSLED